MEARRRFSGLPFLFAAVIAIVGAFIFVIGPMEREPSRSSSTADGAATVTVFGTSSARIDGITREDATAATDPCAHLVPKYARPEYRGRDLSIAEWVSMTGVTRSGS